MSKFENAVCMECGSTSIREQKMNDKIEDIIERMFEGDVDFNLEGNAPWCYLNQFTGTESVDTSEIPLYLEAACQHAGGGLIQISVNSEEGNYQDWLDCLEFVPGCNIIKYPREGRDVFLCTFPVNPDKATV